jgi:molybdopterin-guanine dinucleotide biosynthesis protein A
MTRSVAPIAAFILAGGESSRMGSNKALLELGGVPLIVRMARLVESAAAKPTVVGSPETYAGLRLRGIRDDWPGAGPLGGIATALRASESPWSLIVACDLPYLTKPWLEHLIHRAERSNADVVLPLNDAGAEPLCAMYNKTAESAIWLALDRGIRKVTDGLAGLHIEHIEPREWKAFDSEGLLFKNMNSAADYEEAKARIGERSKP